jgi:hypothetical protein
MTNVNTLFSGGQGVALPSGYLNSYYTAGGSGGTVPVAATNVVKNILSITPAYGVYIVSGQGAYYVSGTLPVGLTRFIVGISNISGTSDGISGTKGILLNPPVIVGEAGTCSSATQILIINASNPTIYLNAYCTYTTANNLTLDLNESYLTAFRIG